VTSHAGEFIAMCMAIGGLLALLIYAWIQNIRDRRAARESAKRDRLHRIAEMGFRSAFMRGLVDRQGNPISRYGEDLH
jgi:hypothetical protein